MNRPVIFGQRGIIDWGRVVKWTGSSGIQRVNGLFFLGRRGSRRVSGVLWSRCCPSRTCWPQHKSCSQLEENVKSSWSHADRFLVLGIKLQTDIPNIPLPGLISGSTGSFLFWTSVKYFPWQSEVSFLKFLYWKATDGARSMDAAEPLPSLLRSSGRCELFSSEVWIQVSGYLLPGFLMAADVSHCDDALPPCCFLSVQVCYVLCLLTLSSASADDLTQLSLLISKIRC